MPRTLRKCELRAEGRRLVGTVLHFADVSPTHRERFERARSRSPGPCRLNLEHDALKAVAWQPDGGLSLRQDRDALTMQATLPPIPAADRALAMVRDGMASAYPSSFGPKPSAGKPGCGLSKGRCLRVSVWCGGRHTQPARLKPAPEAAARCGRAYPTTEELACECIAQAGPGTGGTCIPQVVFRNKRFK